MESCSVLDIVRESTGLLCSRLLPILLLINLVLIFPVSSISLSQVMTNSHLAGQLSIFLTHHLALAGIRVSSLTSLFYLQLSQTLLSQATCIPVILTLWMLAKAAIFYILACRDRGKEASVMGFLEWGPPTWCRIAVTYMWGCLFVILVTAIVLLLEVAGAMLLRFITGTLMDMEDLEGSVYVILETGAMSAYAVVLAPMVIILNLGIVVAGMEETKCGPRALLRVLTLLKRGRLQPALLLFLITGIATTCIEGAFQYRVLGRATLPALGSASSLLEAPILIFLHSFLLLFDTIMSVAFYHTCQSAADASLYFGDKLKQEEEEDHFSIAVHIVEQQCRKMFTRTRALI